MQINVENGMIDFLEKGGLDIQIVPHYINLSKNSNWPANPDLNYTWTNSGSSSVFGRFALYFLELWIILRVLRHEVV